MKKILVMDEKNYTPDLKEIYRVAVRGIIFIDGKLLIHSKHDGLIDYSQAQEFYQTAKNVGQKCELYEVTDKMNTHSAYSAGMFLETRENNKALDKLFSWIEEI